VESKGVKSNYFGEDLKELNSLSWGCFNDSYWNSSGF